MPKTLLVVDDSPTIRETARLALTGEDWVVVCAGTPDEALELLWAQPPHAVLCDADLAGAGAGVALCRKLRALPEGAELPILLMGAAVTPAAAAEAGATAAFPKPFGAAELSDALQAALDTQGFSMDLDALEAASDAPLTLDDLAIPFAAPAAAVASPARAGNEVEIIDLSGDEEYGELELIEDLEPLETVGADANGPRQAPADEAFSLDIDDLFASSAPCATAPAEEVSAEEIDLDALFAAPAEPVPVEAPDELFEELSADDPLSVPARESPSPALWADEPLAGTIPLAAASSVASWDAPLVSAEIPASPVEEPFSYEPIWEEPAGAEPAEACPAPRTASTEEAVRQALAANLSMENLTPTIERVVERVVWEVVPRLAERLIREAIERLQAEPPKS